MADKIDPKIKDWATDLQAQYIDALNALGSITKVAAKFGVERSSVRRGIEAAQRKAALHGHAPGHFNDGVAPGYRMGKVTIQRSAAGVERVWERQHPELDGALRRIGEAADAAFRDLPRLPPVVAPLNVSGALCNLATFSDYHMGMLARKADSGGDWSVSIAKTMLIAAFDQMIANAPKSRVLVINIQGDFIHTDSRLPVTPTSHHVLDADGSYDGMVDATIEVLRRICDSGLHTHDEVHVVMAEGNHDVIGSGVWLRRLFAALYEKEPRLTVNGSRLPYYAYQHGQVMIAVHHGHLKKNDQLPLLMAAMFPAMWGATTKRYVHTGHRHHVEEKEHAGIKVIQHPTLAAPDSYAARGGWISERQATLITYHEEHGEVGRTVVTPEMLAKPKRRGTGRLGLTAC